MSDNQQLLLTESEAAKMLSISPRKLWQLRKDGAMPYVPIGKSVRYRVTDLQRWIDSQVTRQPAVERA
ncbi:MAG: DNA-binding protein [Planctomycetota bacterium]|mgnify:CR=1 FL=1|nr:MAG: DNA-binding protein [Planctomycetota bacterium]REK29312.1 MAG: DNA-binding protein [Planctomycetota bacterium]REK35953.1 MAG: DNA-binding protein [Planctomycetota bacterium]